MSPKLPAKPAPGAAGPRVSAGKRSPPESEGGKRKKKAGSGSGGDGGADALARSPNLAPPLDSFHRLRAT